MTDTYGVRIYDGVERPMKDGVAYRSPDNIRYFGVEFIREGDRLTLRAGHHYTQMPEQMRLLFVTHGTNNPCAGVTEQLLLANEARFKQAEHPSFYIRFGTTVVLKFWLLEREFGESKKDR